MEYLITAIILYFVVQATGNLVRIVRDDSDRADASSSRSGRPDWSGPSPRDETGSTQRSPTFWDRDIEDATWRDVRE